MERVLILSAGVGSGHNSAAAAVETACRARPDVEAVEVVDVLQLSTTLYRDLLAKGYFVLVAGVPWLVEWGYDVSDPPFRRRGPIDPWTRVNALPAVREIRRFRPTSIICTHFLPAQLISSLLLRGTIDARTAIVTTDYDFQGLWLASAFHAFFVAREEARVQLIALGLPADRVTASGIPVQPPAPPVAHDPDAPPTLLVSAGAAGGDYAMSVVRQILRLRSPFRAIVVCGRNDALRRQIARLVGSDERFEVLGFSSEMPRLLRAASLFVGKPGGLSASECMAAGLPMVLVNPIPGQEVRNGDYLIEQGAAVRCNSAATIGWKIDGILADPDRLTRMRGAAAALGRADAAHDVVETLLSGPRAPVVVTRGAQKTVLSAAEKHVTADDLTGPTSLQQLTATSSDSTVAVVRTSELAELRRITDQPEGALVLDHRTATLAAGARRFEARRLIECVLADEPRIEVAPR